MFATWPGVLCGGMEGMLLLVRLQFMFRLVLPGCFVAGAAANLPTVPLSAKQVIFAPAHDPREWTAHAPEAMDGQFINVQVQCGAGWCTNSNSSKEQSLWLPVTINSGKCVVAAGMHCAGSALLVSKLLSASPTHLPSTPCTAALGQHGDGQPPGLWAV